MSATNPYAPPQGALGVIPFYGLIDVLFIFGVRRQCLHDLIADTIVVRA